MSAAGSQSPRCSCPARSSERAVNGTSAATRRIRPSARFVPTVLLCSAPGVNFHPAPRARRFTDELTLAFSPLSLREVGQDSGWLRGLSRSQSAAAEAGGSDSSSCAELERARCSCTA